MKPDRPVLAGEKAATKRSMKKGNKKSSASCDVDWLPGLEQVLLYSTQCQENVQLY